jgi:hypothetical protein
MAKVDSTPPPPSSFDEAQIATLACEPRRRTLCTISRRCVSVAVHMCAALPSAAMYTYLP